MKCGYANCTHGGEVDKKDAVKLGTKYFHKDCLEKKETKSLISSRMVYDMGFMQKTTNMAIKAMIDDKNIEPQFVLFTLNYVWKNGLELNSPFGLSYYFENYKVKDAYAEQKKLEKIKEVRAMVRILDDISDTNFNYVKKEPKYLNPFGRKQD